MILIDYPFNDLIKLTQCRFPMHPQLFRELPEIDTDEINVQKSIRLYLFRSFVEYI